MGYILNSQHISCTFQLWVVMTSSVKNLLTIACIWIAGLGTAYAKVFDPAVRCALSLQRVATDPEVAQQVSDYVDRMPFIRHREPHNPPLWKVFVHEMLKIDFSKPGPYRFVWRNPAQDERSTESISFEVDEKIVQGWRLLGIINAEGRFNLNATPQSIAEAFEKHTGWKADLSPKKELLDHFDFARLILEKRPFPFDDIHALLFHAPYLTDAFRRDMLHLTARFAALEETIAKRDRFVIPHSMRVMSFQFEGYVALNGRLTGPIPLVLHFGSIKPSHIPREKLEADLKQTPAATLSRKIRDGADFTEFHLHANDTEDWQYAVKVMKLVAGEWLKYDEAASVLPELKNFILDLDRIEWPVQE